MNSSEALQPAICRACKAPLRSGARKCTECGTDQTWIHHVSQVSLVVATLSAIISLGVLAGTSYYENVVPKTGKLSFSTTGELHFEPKPLQLTCTGPTGERTGEPFLFGPPAGTFVLPIIATNTGRAPLQISDASITFLAGGKDGAPEQGFADARLIQSVDLLPRQGKVIPLRFRVGREWNEGFGWREFPLQRTLMEGGRYDFGTETVRLTLTYTSVKGQQRLELKGPMRTFASLDSQVTIDGKALNPPTICS